MTSLIAACLFLVAGMQPVCSQSTLRYEAAPPDNPLKGLVPYSGDRRGIFPHSMEFFYLPLSELMTADEEFNWSPLEKQLNDIAGRGHQAVFRIWMEYPGRQEGIPPFLENAGLKVTVWTLTGTDPAAGQRVRTPDYEAERLRKSLRRFIAAMGKRYDGDPRIGFITAGLLGIWGEWHNWPRTDLMPSKAVQRDVMDAYERAFRRTPILLRYPAGPNDLHYAANHDRRLGYHDDSFAFATLETGREEDSWFFVPALKRAGPSALTRWKTSPMGGEIRPELWGQIFDARPRHAGAQDFSECVRVTHATWLMDTGMFAKKQSAQRIRNASKQVQRMGYEFHVESAQWSQTMDSRQLKVVLRNTGVAPFYYNWKVELVSLSADGDVKARYETDWSVANLLPGETRVWRHQLTKGERSDKGSALAVRVVNPLPNGLPLRFANARSRQTKGGALRLERVSGK